MPNCISRVFVLLALILVTTGCKVAIMVTTGGDVQSLSGANNCAGGNVCEINIASNNFDDTFTALPREGYEFVKWQEGDSFKCGGSTNPTCRINNTGLDLNPVIADLIAQDGFDYLVPIFRFVGIDTDRDGIKDYADEDDDGDGIPDNEDLCPLNPILSCGTNEVSGIFYEDVTWSPENSPIHVVGNVQIAEGATLTILPGTEIIGTGGMSGTSIQVFGTFDIQGIEGALVKLDRIVIYATGTGTGPASIEYVHSISSLVRNNIGEVGEDLFDSVRNSIYEGGLPFGHSFRFPADGSGIVENNVFRNLSGGFINANVRNNVFVDVSFSASSSEETGVSVSNNLFVGGSIGTKVAATNNSFIGMGPSSVHTGEHIRSTVDIELGNNYWGTTDTSIIDGIIFDRSDDLNLAAFINYLPVLSEPHPDTPTEF